MKVTEYNNNNNPTKHKRKANNFADSDKDTSKIYTLTLVFSVGAFEHHSLFKQFPEPDLIPDDTSTPVLV